MSMIYPCVCIEGTVTTNAPVTGDGQLPVDTFDYAIAGQTLSTDKTAPYSAVTRAHIDDTATRVAPTGPGVIEDAIVSRVLTNYMNDLYHQSLSPWNVGVMGAYQQYNFHPVELIYDDCKGRTIAVVHTYNGADLVTHAGAYMEIEINQAGEILHQVWQAVMTGSTITSFVYIGRAWPLWKYYSDAYARRNFDAPVAAERAKVIATTGAV